MKKAIGTILLGLFLFLLPAHAWNCSNPSAERVDVGPTLPSGASAGDGDGQYYKGSDAANPNDYYVCKVVNPNPPTKPTGGNSSASQSNSTSNAGAAATATGGKSNSNSTSSATGGTSSATGGSATGGSSKSGVSGSGNSSNTNNNNATGGAGGNATASGGAGGQGGQGGAGGLGFGGSASQNQTQSTSSQATNNGNGSNNTSTVTNVAAARIPVNTAVAPPVVPTAPCFKGFGAGVQTPMVGASFGGGKVDQNCAALEASRMAPNLLARCMIFITTKYAKAAGVTLPECMERDEQVTVEAPAPAPILAPPAPVVINVAAPIVPAPVVNIIASTPAPAVVVHASPKVPHGVRKCVPTVCPSDKGVVFTDDGRGRIQAEEKQ